jgi:hypothetical protein
MKQALEVTMNIIEGEEYRKRGQTNVGQLIQTSEKNSKIEEAKTLKNIRNIKGNTNK